MNMAARELTIGQKAVVDGYLENFFPTGSHDPEDAFIVDTDQMVNEMSGMCDIDGNALADYLAEKGYRVYFDQDKSIGGWLLGCVGPVPDDPDGLDLPEFPESVE